MRSERIKYWDHAARLAFEYTPDGQQDTWRSHADLVLGHAYHWSGDCDDLTSTVLDLCAKEGAPLEDRYFLVVMSTAGGHAVGCIRDDDGKLWIVGDTFGPTYPVEQMAHKPIQYHRQSEALDVWRAGVPWEIVQS